MQPEPGRRRSWLDAWRQLVGRMQEWGRDEA
jgi:hypothetical protein